jgi:hypothetical protein
MSEPVEGNAGGDGAGAEGPIPLENPADGGAPARPEPAAAPPRAVINRESVLRLEDDTCPKCGSALKPGDVVCFRCGYDLKANVVRTVEARGPDDSEEGEGSGGGADEFVTPGIGSAKVWAIVGTVLTVAAMILAGVFVPQEKAGWLRVAGAVFLALYNIVVHTGTGVVAVAVAARIVEERFGSLELAVARVFAAFSLFEAIRHVRLPLGALSTTAAYVLAAAAYYLAIWGLFRKNRTVTLLIVLVHVVLWIVFQLGVMLAAAAQGTQAGAA